MLKPQTFQQLYITFQNTPYVEGDQSSQVSCYSGGVLGRGQMVWTQDIYTFGKCPRSAAAFVEGLGIVSLNPLALARADILTFSELELRQTA